MDIKELSWQDHRWNEAINLFDACVIASSANGEEIDKLVTYVPIMSLTLAISMLKIIAINNNMDRRRL